LEASERSSAKLSKEKGDYSSGNEFGGFFEIKSRENRTEQNGMG
jgi:hypothetical protein